MPIEHKNITGVDLHEPKDVAASSNNHVYLADGAGSGDWELANPHGGFYYSNIGTGETFTAPTSYTLINASTTTTHQNQVTHNNLGRFTYSGITDRHFHFAANLSVKHSTGSGQDIFFGWHKNGVLETGSEIVQSADSANYDTVVLHWDGVFSTDDYMEVFTKVSSGNIIVHSFYLFGMGMPT